MLCYCVFYSHRFKTSLPSPRYCSHCLHSTGRKCVNVLPEGTSTGSAGCLFDLQIAKRNKTPFCPRSRGRKQWPALLSLDSLYFCAESQLVSCIKQAHLSDRRWLTKLQRPSGATQGNVFYLFYPTDTKISILGSVHSASFKSWWQEETNDTLQLATVQWCSSSVAQRNNRKIVLLPTCWNGSKKNQLGLLSMWQHIHRITLQVVSFRNVFSGLSPRSRKIRHARLA